MPLAVDESASATLNISIANDGFFLLKIFLLNFIF